MNRYQLYGIFKKSFKDWLEDNAVLRAAALTFFIIIPLPTLLLIVLAVFTFFLGDAHAIQILVEQIAALSGPSVAELFRQLLVISASPFSSLWTAIVVVGFSIGGAIGAFSVLRETMDRIWDVKLSKGQPLWKKIRQKIVPFVVISALGLIVFTWTLGASSLFSAITRFSVNQVFTFVVLEIAQIMLSFGIAVLLLAIIYKMIPEATIHWQDIALASVVTGVAFTVTNYIFGFYIQVFVVTTVGGAAGALLIILLWIYVLNLIVLFGAEVSKVYAITVGTHSKQHVPSSIQKVIEPLKKVGEKIEQAAKEEVVKTGETSMAPERKKVEEEGHS